MDFLFQDNNDKPHMMNEFTARHLDNLFSHDYQLDKAYNLENLGVWGFVQDLPAALQCAST